MSKDQVKELVSNIKEVLDKHNIVFWLDMGTLLGAARDGQMIKWDNDIDFSAWYKDFKSFDLVIKDFKKLGYEVHLKEHKILIKKTVFNVDIYLHREKDNFAVNFWGRSSIIWTRLVWKYKYFAHFLYLMKMDFNSKFYMTASKSNKNLNTSRKIIEKLVSFIPFKFRNELMKAIDKIMHRYYRVKVPKFFFNTLDEISYYGMSFKSPNYLEEYLKCRYGPTWKTPNPKWAWPLHMEAELKSNFINKNDISCDLGSMFK